MPDTALAVATFPSRDAAEGAIGRLVSEGFARNSMELDRIRDGYRVAVHARSKNHGRVQRLLAEQPGVLASAVALGSIAADSMIEAAQGEIVQHAVETAGGLAVTAAKAHPIVAFGAAMVAGVAVYKLLGGRLPALPSLGGFSAARRVSARRQRSPRHHA